MTWQDSIVVDPAILTGKPIIKGTRITVEFLLHLLAEGWTAGEITRNYPSLTSTTSTQPSITPPSIGSQPVSVHGSNCFILPHLRRRSPAYLVCFTLAVL